MRRPTGCDSIASLASMNSKPCPVSAPPLAGLFFCRRLRFHNRMVPEFDAYAAATAIIRQYGEEARLHATKRADALLKAGDSNGHAVFKRILRVIEELQRTAPKSAEAVH